MPRALHTPRDAALEQAFADEVREATRSSGTVLALVALAAVPAWTVVDLLLEPPGAELFLGLRGACVAAMLLAFVVLRRSRLGMLRPGRVMLVLLALPQCTLAAMTAGADGAAALYASGLSVSLYAAAFVLVWPWRYMLALVGTTAVAVAVAFGLTPGAWAAGELPGLVSYLACASLLAIGGQYVRHSLARREFLARHALEREQERTGRLLERLERLTHQDDLTGLANRRSWNDALRAALARSRRDGSPLALLLCDLDHFKQVNDRHGHLTGDHVLRLTATAIAQRSRASDLAARLGGDEFALLCPDTTLAEASALAAELVRRPAEVPLPDGSRVPATLSIGVAALEPTDERTDDLVARADRELYQAKDRRNAVSVQGARPLVA